MCGEDIMFFNNIITIDVLDLGMGILIDLGVVLAKEYDMYLGI